MEVNFEGKAFPDQDQKEQFGYEPHAVYVLDGSSGSFRDKQRFEGASSEEILQEMENAFLGFEYVNSDTVKVRHGSEDQNPVQNQVPIYQREAVPAEIIPNEGWLGTLKEIEDTVTAITDTEYSVAIGNEGETTEPEELEELRESYISSFPDIKGVSNITYKPKTREAEMVLYNEKLKVPSDPHADMEELIKGNSTFEIVDYQRDRNSIDQLVKNHDNWNITSNILPNYELPDEIYMQNFTE